ncbi:hypothetical protein QBC35DRAFT_460474 [Podospora australis]|uniref:Heterokaryon incompatibility domain-containing protein n=1 Tax=Podospora australis TaxID=1536484 RepID=A0AAN6X2U4_9PEZI|nr:hypothetical protein QBC35DRAFT_460474 [Podospora australis]
MICAVCMAVFQSSQASGNHHKDFKDLEQAAKNGCRICHVFREYFLEGIEEGHVFRGYFLASIEGEGPRLKYDIKFDGSWRDHWRLEVYPDGENEHWIKGGGSPRVYIQVLPEDNGFPVGYSDFLDCVDNDLRVDPTKVRREFPVPRFIPDNTGHPEVAKTARHWFENCRCRKRGQQRRPVWYPPRLINVGQFEGGPAHLVERETQPLEGYYATLSHCWGESPDFITLTEDNLDEFRKCIPLDQLPASFRDAILTCQRIDIPYLWIDSLCILQSGEGAPSDWHYHVSGEMTKIYANCDLNIAIDVAENPHQGAFRSRDPTYLQDCLVWTYGGPGFGQHVSKARLPPQSVGSASHSGVFRCAIFQHQDFHVTREDLPLIKRAWVYQERLLSPRTLHFQADRIAWQCDHWSALTEYLHGDLAYANFDCLYQIQFNLTGDIVEKDPLHLFFDRVFQYSCCDLSHPTKDKLVAFAAIARHFSLFIGGEYCAGLFRSSMPLSLLWEASGRRSNEYRAPSWSWANIDGRIRDPAIFGFGYHINGRPEHEPELLAKVQNVSVELVDQTNPYGQVRSASISLSGPFAAWAELFGDLGETATLSLEPKEPASFWRPIGLQTGRGLFVDITLDDRSWSGPTSRLFFVAIATDASGPGSWEEPEQSKTGEICDPTRSTRECFCWGLLLQRLQDGMFQRVAMWQATYGLTESGGFKETTVTII